MKKTTILRLPAPSKRRLAKKTPKEIEVRKRKRQPNRSLTEAQTRAPTGKREGPAAGLLPPRPMVFHVIGVTVSVDSTARLEVVKLQSFRLRL